MRNTAKIEVRVDYLDGEFNMFRAEEILTNESELRLKLSEKKEEIIPIVNVRKYSIYTLTDTDPKEEPE